MKCLFIINPSAGTKTIQKKTGSDHWSNDFKKAGFYN